MKKRFLPICFFAFFVGFSFLFNSIVTIASNPGDGNAKKLSSGNSGFSVERLTQIRNNQVTGTVDPADFLKAQQEVEKMAPEKGGSSLNLNWLPVGPNNAAGRTRTVIFDNRDASGLTMYTGGVAGGIWKSVNLGLTWEQVNTQNNEVLRVTCLTQTPSGTIYAGTGETYCTTFDLVGTGLYRSDDGNLFTLVPGTQPTANDPTSSWAYITKLACSPSGRVFAATNTGLMYSDNGTDWNTAIQGFAIDVVVGSDGTVAAAVNKDVYIAAGGEIGNFVNVSTGAATALPTTKIGWVALAIAPGDPSIMYASLSDSISGKLYGVYFSEDKGATWRVVFPSNSNYNPLGTHGCYANTLQVYPNDSFKVLLGGEDMWVGTKLDSTGYFNWEQVSTNLTSPIDPSYVPISHHAYLFRPNNHAQVAIASDDGIYLGTISSSGFTFQQLIKNLKISQFNSLAFSNSRTGVLGGGINIGTQYIPGGTVLNEPMNGEQIDGNVGGNGGECAWSLINPNTIVYSVSGAKPPVTRSEDFGVTPSPTFVDTLSATLPAYFSIYNWESFDYPYSQDSVTYKAIEKDVPADSTVIVYSKCGKFPLRYTTPVAIPIGDSVRVQDIIQSRFFLGNVRDTSGIYMTKDLLKFSINPVWFKIAKVDGKDPISCLTVSKDLSVLWAGSQKGKLYRISNLQLANNRATADIRSSTCIVATTTIANPALAGRYVTSISIAPDNKTVLVTLGNYSNTYYVYLSSNGLDSLPDFHAVQGNLPAMPVHTSLFEMSNSSRVLLGTDFGAFSTENITVASPVWSLEANGMGNVPVIKLAQQTDTGTYYHRMNNYGIIYSATFGSGIFMDTTYYSVLDVGPGKEPSLSSNSLKIYPNPAQGKINISYKLAHSGDVSLFFYDMMGKAVLSRELGKRLNGNHTESIDISSVPAGTTLVRLSYGTGNIYGKLVKIK